RGGLPRAVCRALAPAPRGGPDPAPRHREPLTYPSYDCAARLGSRGYAVAVPCLPPCARRLGDRDAYGKQDPCAVPFVRMQLLGKVLMAENLRDCLWALELLTRREEVDPKRLACVGLSYGGRPTVVGAPPARRRRVAMGA